MSKNFTPNESLAARCRELLELQATGVLPQGELRQMAAKDPARDGHELKRAEAATAREAMRFVVQAAGLEEPVAPHIRY